MKPELNNSWAVLGTRKNINNKKAWKKLMHFIHKNADRVYNDDLGLYYGIGKDGFGTVSTFKSDFDVIVSLEEAIEFIDINSAYIGAPGSDIDDLDVHLPKFKVENIDVAW